MACETRGSKEGGRGESSSQKGLPGGTSDRTVGRICSLGGRRKRVLPTGEGRKKEGGASASSYPENGGNSDRALSWRGSLISLD